MNTIKTWYCRIRFNLRYTKAQRAEMQEWCC